MRHGRQWVNDPPFGWTPRSQGEARDDTRISRQPFYSSRSQGLPEVYGNPEVGEMASARNEWNAYTSSSLAKFGLLPPFLGVLRVDLPEHLGTKWILVMT